MTLFDYRVRVSISEDRMPQYVLGDEVNEALHDTWRSTKVKLELLNAFLGRLKYHMGERQLQACDARTFACFKWTEVRCKTWLQNYERNVMISYTEQPKPIMHTAQPKPITQTTQLNPLHIYSTAKPNSVGNKIAGSHRLPKD